MKGHVAARMHDVRDANADGSCAGGTHCDPSGADSALMSQIWRDSFWRSNFDNIGQYWNRLCSELDAPQGSAAVRALAFNEIECVRVQMFFLCRAGGCAGRRYGRQRSPGASRPGLRNTPLGRRVIDLYYRHSAEVTKLMKKDGELRKIAASLFGQAADAYRRLRKGGEQSDIMLDARHAKMAHQFIERVQKEGSPELMRDFEEVRRLVDQAAHIERFAEVRTVGQMTRTVIEECRTLRRRAQGQAIPGAFPISRTDKLGLF